MTRKAVFFAILFALFASPMFADSSAETAIEPVSSELILAEEEAPAVDVADVELFQTFEESLAAMAAGGTEGWCGGWGTIPGCTSNRQCYAPDKCDFTGGACVSNCCYCY